MKLLYSDINLVQNYLNVNKDRCIIDIYNEIRNKPNKKRTKEEIIVYTYLFLNKKKLGLKWFLLKEVVFLFDFNILIDFYFTKWLFMASVFYGICQIFKKLVLRR